MSVFPTSLLGLLPLAGMSPERITAAQARFRREEAERVGAEVLPLVTAPVAAAPGRSRVAAVPTR
ncbi:hypothetical protein ACLQ28_01805 [Micromonospora sp. DT201]|uniref:hypothetical protein n=1 Tax=Micromonospora sp. DT201 TaxID=3393442 RepID=UPI003CEF7819